MTLTGKSRSKFEVGKRESKWKDTNLDLINSCDGKELLFSLKVECSRKQRDREIGKS